MGLDLGLDDRIYTMRLVFELGLGKGGEKIDCGTG